jgi:hypothetical protein
VAQTSDCEFAKIGRPEDHKTVLAEFSISGPQCLKRAIVVDCLFSGMEAFFGLAGQDKDVEFTTS